MHQLFEEQVRKTPDKTAVIACDKTLTYIELNEQANRIAHSLIEKGVQVGDIVAFALPRKSYLIAAIFGILKSGAVYLPIDSDSPKGRIEYILSDSNAKFFITEDSIEGFLNNGSIENLHTNESGKDLCYCIYTSETTGKPKGVLIRHCNLSNFCNNNSRNNYQSVVINSRGVLLSVFKCCFNAFGADYAV